MTNWKALPSTELLKLHADIADELRDREILRSSNNPTADVAELLFCRAFGWTQAAQSHPSADATCAEGKLYQIKGRRVTSLKGSRQLGALRKLSDGGFHYLAAVLFAPDYSVTRAAIIPHELVLKNSVYVKHTNAWKFMLRDASWTWPGVRDVTEELRAVRL
jgi:hypothetical protein